MKKVRSSLLTLVAAVSVFALLATPAQAGGKKKHCYRGWNNGGYGYYQRGWNNGGSGYYRSGYYRSGYYRSGYYQPYYRPVYYYPDPCYRPVYYAPAPVIVFGFGFR